MMPSKNRLLLLPLQHAPVVLFVIVLVVFGTLSSKFLEPANLVNILIQSSSVGVVATGMTFVLLTAGIDLSVGSIMFLSAAVAGKMVLGGYPLPISLAAIIVIGLLYGALNAFFITKLKIIPFIVTLATLYVGRGLGLLISQTRAMNLPEEMLQMGTGSLLGIPSPVIIFLLVTIAGHIALTSTTFGRQIYAVGNNREAAQKAGIRTERLVASVYLISGLCAALGGIVSVSQLGAVSPTFGINREFVAIAAAVLGGTSLFGGRGNIFPGTVLGVILLQTVENGLVIINADPYLYPLVIGSIIFFAVLVDSLRHTQLQKLGRRPIRVEEAG